jgi:hypothetical protein
MLLTLLSASLDFSIGRIVALSQDHNRKSSIVALSEAI